MKKTIPTPRFINICFLAFLLLPLIIGVGVYQASASKLDEFCERHFIKSFLMPVMPTAKNKCKVQFQKFEMEWRNGYLTK